MPRRTIVIGRQPPAVEFQDDFGPLNNGLGYLAGQWLAAGRDRAQIEMQREAKSQEDTQRQQDRAQDVDFRRQDLGLRRLALEQGQENREEELGIRRDELKRQQGRDAAEAGAKLRDDIGAVGKYALDWLRGGNPNGAGRSGSSQGGWRIHRDPFGGPDTFYRTAPDGALETLDEQGNVIRRGGPAGSAAAPVGAPPAPPAPVAAPTEAEPGVVGTWWDWTKEGAGALRDLALGGGEQVPVADAPPAPVPAPVATGAAPVVQPGDLQQAVTRATSTLTMAPAGMTAEQRQRLARAVAAAQQGNPQAIEALMRWHSKQPDAIQRVAQDRNDQGAMAAGADALDRFNASGIR